MTKTDENYYLAMQYADDTIQVHIDSGCYTKKFKDIDILNQIWLDAYKTKLEEIENDIA